MASKSFSTRSCENPKRLANSRRRKRQLVRLVSAISSPSQGPATASVAARGRAPVSSRYRATAASRSATVSFSITNMRWGAPAELASANRLLLPPISPRRVVRIAAIPIDNHLLANGLRRRQARTAVFPCCSCSVRPRQAKNVLGEVGQDQVGRDRRGLIEPRLAELALDVELLGKAEAAVGLQAHVGGRPGGVGGKELGHVGLGAALAPGLIEGRGRAHHQLGRAHLRIGARDRELYALVLANRPAEHDALLGIAGRLGDAPLGVADALRRDLHALGIPDV